jgi:GDSL-like Lipase/Acylhydrolase family
MSKSAARLLLILIATIPTAASRGQEIAGFQSWDYAAAMKKVAAAFTGRPGVVLHIGDSITYANPYTQWARGGRGKTAEDRAILDWMHAGADDDSDGWWLARFDHPDGGRSYTACSGLRADELLAGGKHHLPSLVEMLTTFRPQMVVLMLGTNDASAGRSVAAYRADMESAVDQILERGIIPILSTIPPHPQRMELSKEYNEALRALARSRSLPIIDYEREILERRPSDWNGTLLGKDIVHPTPIQSGPPPAPTAENLRSSGYLLRGWLSVRKIAEVKRLVLDKPIAIAAVAAPPQAPDAQPLKLLVTRDTWFSNYPREANGSNGGSPRLKLKSNQEMSLIDVDPAPLAGRVIRSATLFLRSTGEPRLKRVTVGSFGADWVEGTATDYATQSGSSTFKQRRHPDVPWTVAGSDLCSVILGQGGTTWRMAEASAPDGRGWQRVTVDPVILAARVAGISTGLFLFDDTGTEWTRDGQRYTQRMFPNRFVHSRESGPESAPYLTIELGPEDRTPPEAPGTLQSDVDQLPAGEAWISWTTPRDEGPAGTLGFLVRAGGNDLPRYLIPLAGQARERVRMHLRDLGLRPGSEVEVEIRAVDAAGNIGPAAAAKVRVSSLEAAPFPPPIAARPAATPAPDKRPRLGEVEIAIVDELDKIQPLTGAMIPPQPDGYLDDNHLWNSQARRVSLHAARNEFVAFQVVLKGNPRGVVPSLEFQGPDAAKIQVEFSRYHLVPTNKGPLPDPIVSLTDQELPLNKNGRSLYCELFVSPDAQPGEHQGKLSLKADGQTLSLDVVLRVWNFTLPDVLSFLPDMNCYDLPANERDYYRLAHRHRTVLNRVPYHQSGAVSAGCAPAWDGKILDWSAWDRLFGPYFDGTAFADLPRQGVPIECFYLPIHENWPTPIEPNYNGGYWADRAFTDSYRRDLVEVSRQFSEHMNSRRWTGTLFQFFLNGKNDFKTNGWSRGSSPWLLDEPAHFQDFWALRYFGAAFHEGISQSPGPAKLVFRCDISRPQWQRDALDGLLDYNVVSSALRAYQRLVLDRKQAEGQIVVEYGTANALEDSNTQAVGWSIDSWSLGSDGVLPWQTVGTSASWTKADTLSLFYPGRGGQGAGPVPSIRLKAYRRGQQDVEYLTLLSLVTGQPRWAIGERAREALHLAAERRGTGLVGGEDAGVVHYRSLLPQDLWAFRLRVAQALSEAHPAPRRQLVDLRTPPRNPAHLSPGYARTSASN